MSSPSTSLSRHPPLTAAIFNGSAGFTVNGGNFQIVQNYHHTSYSINEKIGLVKLYEVSIPEAAHDSSARKYAAKCYPGTREQHIQDFVRWVSGASYGGPCRFRIFWMSGPFGVGKSAIAQTCAERVERHRLGAAFFFSALNQRDDPDRFFPSIAHQISTQIEPFADILNARISMDPSILTKTMELQFQELIVVPFLKLRTQGVELSERVIIIDGLDECRDNRAQCCIVELIATAVREHEERLPFLWAFFSRPEPHIVETFSSETIFPLFWKTALSPSRELDQEIEYYIRGEFENIKKRKHISSPSRSFWPSNEDISRLVDKTDGLYVYASTVMKYIGDPNALDPVELLKTILSLHWRDRSIADGYSPTAELDLLYTLVMKRIPLHILPTTQQMLLLNNDSTGFKAFGTLYEILGLNFSSAITALSKLHSVLVAPENDSESIKFYHASFMEFLWDMRRSGPELCIEQPHHYESLLKRALVFIEGFEPSEIQPIDWNPEITTRQRAYASVTLHAIGWIDLVMLNEELSILLAGIDFAKHAKHLRIDQAGLEMLFNRIPPAQREQVIKKYKPSFSLLRWAKNTGRPAIGYILGHGEKSIRYEFDKHGKNLRRLDSDSGISERKVF